jgi:glycosyltransferase involved in cell wall biosynthesis
MLLRRLYYYSKPFIPRPVRLAVRAAHARRILRGCGDIWPVTKTAGGAPEEWPGWPDGKQCAVVLTHDIEGRDGVNRVRKLAEMEMGFGFRSCFNFIPEGGYTVPGELRAWLLENGFEVGVHDLKHDGHLFASRNTFRERAVRINHYLKEWGATGFRAGFMLNELEWLHDLNIRYDCSTFDTDPFEPQPEGWNTIFPFWMSGPDEAGPSGYVEMPYTLPQDSTLFLLLGEKSPDIWMRKFDWILERGGMALVNVHPDYLRFEGEAPSSRTYPATYYRELLEHIRATQEAVIWQALPREVAEFTSALAVRPTVRQPKRVCMIAYSHYETDGRVTRYAEALAERGDHVDVVALKRSPDEAGEVKVGNVNLHKLQPRVGKGESSPLAVLLPLLQFLMRATFWVARRHSWRAYDVLHVHNMPDFLVFAAAYPKLTGAKVLLDIHDIVPEFYGSKFEGGELSPTVTLLKAVERVCAAMSDRVIVSNDLWLEKYATRTGANGKCSVFINNVDTRVFKPHTVARNDGKAIILFPGGLQWHQGLDIALRAFKRVSQEVPNSEFHIYGDGIMKPELVRLAKELGFNGNVRFFDPVKMTDIAKVMAGADLGVVPKRADSFGNEAYSTKIMEFMAVGVPVVVSNTKIDKYYFDDSVVRFFESGNHDTLAVAMLEMLRDEPRRREMAACALAYADRHSWESRKVDYLALVDSLCGNRSVHGAAATREEKLINAGNN